MRNTWQSLIWKEWHEHKWKLVSIVAILWTTAAVSLFYIPSDGLGIAMLLMSFCVVPLGSFVGLSAAANERSRGTMAFLQALPTPMWPVAIAKLVLGLFTLVMSVVLTLPLLYGWVYWFEHSSGETSVYASGHITVTGNVFLDIVLLCGTLGVSFYIWSAAAGVNRKDEVSAGAVALVVIVGWCMFLLIAAHLLSELFERKHLFRNTQLSDAILQGFAAVGLSSVPGGFVSASAKLWDNAEKLSDREWHRYLILIISTATFVHIALAVWYVRRFGRITNLAVRSPQTAVRQSARADWLSSPRQSSISAIAWKQCRESAPLIVAGLAGVAGIALGIFGANPDWFRTHQGEFAQMIFTVGSFIGFAVTLIAGVGVCFYDVTPQTNTFWRSRPINPDTWYWVKFFTALFILIVTFSIPLSCLVLAFNSYPRESFSPTFMTALLAGQISLFSAAVATTCLARDAVYGAILSIPLMFLGVIVEWLVLKVAGVVGWIDRAPRILADLTYGQIGLGFLLTSLVSMLLGWLAMRYDWGRKSRY